MEAGHGYLKYFLIDVAHIIFMENFSENKRKRGRPPKMLDIGKTRKEYISKLAKEGMAEGKGERTKINNFYLHEAQAVLWDSDFSYLIINDDKTGTTKIKKRTILYELGRLEDPDIIRDVARVICENKLYTAEAVVYIRQHRTGGKPAGSNIDLARVIGKTIDEYMLKHSDVNEDMIRESLNIVFNVFSENVSNIEET